MKEILADTSYSYALANRKDPYHSIAAELSEALANTGAVSSKEVLGETLKLISRIGRTDGRELAVETILTIV